MQTRGATRSVTPLLPLLGLYVLFTYLAPEALAPVQDERNYLRIADNLAHGDYATESSDNPAHYVWHGPGLPLLVAPLVALDLPVALVRLVGALILFAAIVVFRRWLELYCRSPTALAGAYALGIYWPFLTFLPHLHSDVLAVLLIVAACYLAARYLRSGDKLQLLGAGAALGWLALTRLEFGWPVIAALVASLVWWSVRRRRPEPLRLAAVCAIAVAICVPWLAYTQSVSDRLLYWSNAGGLSLYWTASPYSDELGDWHDPGDVFEEPRLARHRPFFAQLERLPPLERDRRLQEVAVERIQERSPLYVRNVALNAARLWFGVPHTGKSIEPEKLFFIIPNGLILLALAFSLTRLWRARRSLPPEVTAFSVFGSAYLALHCLVAAEARLLAPFIPIAVWLVVYTFDNLLERPHHGAGLPRPDR